MAELQELDRAFATIMADVVESGTAPHHTDLAARMGIDVGAARDIVHELMAMTPGWTHPGTDYIASFPPFNLQPTHYKVSIDGQAGWYAQCGFEAMAIRWLVPGRTVRIDAPCLCCGEAITVEMQDEDISIIEPMTAVGYTSSAVGGAADDRPFR